MSESTAEPTPDKLTFVPYTDDVEQIQPNEAEDIDAVIASFDRLREKTFDKHRHAIRDAHAKSHGALKGELTIYEGLAAPYRQGLFREARTYPVIIRFSTAPAILCPMACRPFAVWRSRSSAFPERRCCLSTPTRSRRTS